MIFWGCIASLIGLMIWAPFAFEMRVKSFYMSGWFKLLICAIAFFYCMIIMLNYDQINYIPWMLGLILLSLIDIKTQSVRMLDLVILGSLLTPFILNQALGHIIMMNSIVLVVLLFLKYIFKRIYRQDAFGSADIWVIMSILIAFGSRSALVAIYCAIFISALYGFIAISVGKASKSQRIPFIPFLTLGSLIALFFSKELLNIYTNLFIV